MDFSVFLPPFTSVELPSKGLLYSKDNPLSSGWVHIRAYAGPEEALLATMNSQNWYMVINQMLASCIEEKIDIGLLTNEDAFFILTWLRATSYSPLFDVEATCPFQDCQHAEKYVINLGTDLTFHQLAEDVTEPLIIELSVTKLTVHLRCMRRNAEVKAQRRQAEITQYRGYLGDPTDLLKRAYSIIKVIAPNGEETSDILELESLCLEYLPSADSLEIDTAMLKFQHGVDTNISLVCKACERTMYTRLPSGASFFRPEILVPTK